MGSSNLERCKGLLSSFDASARGPMTPLIDHQLKMRHGKRKPAYNTHSNNSPKESVRKLNKTTIEEVALNIIQKIDKQSARLPRDTFQFTSARQSSTLENNNKYSEMNSDSNNSALMGLTTLSPRTQISSRVRNPKMQLKFQ